jgi:hypothetical protein
MTAKAGKAAKGLSRGDMVFLAIVVVIGLPVYAIVTLIEQFGLWAAGLAVLGLIGVGAGYWKWLQIRRASRLRAKYLDPELAQRLIAGEIWEGQTPEELEDAVGKPVSVNHVKRAGVEREVWNYLPYEGRYRMRVTLDDGLVASWFRLGGRK